ncbi:MAG: hypothetical protein EP319_10795 [Deltaproteobacteria bacterium]|nr:MAG: hypothetical protein EP319_10795 [Deltaproteobacteria bacterium]
MRMLTKFNLIQIFLLVLLFLPLATFSSETKKERLDFIRNLESRIQKDIPKMDMEKRYQIYVDAARELHRFHFNNYAVKYLNKALLLEVKSSKVPVWIKLLGIHHQEGQFETLKVDLGRFNNWVNTNKVKLSTRAKSANDFYTFITSTESAETILSKEQINQLQKSFFASEFNWVNFERLLRHKKWEEAKSMVNFSQVKNSSNWTKLKVDLLNLNTKNSISTLHCNDFKKTDDLNPEHLMCQVMEDHLKKKPKNPALMAKFHKSLNALKPEYHWFYRLVKELQS